MVGFTHPFFAYYDRQFTCATCSHEFVFRKEEQQYWYEELQFITWSYAKDCPTCRKNKRAPNLRSQRIQTLVEAIDPTDFQQIEALIGLYLELHNFDKANFYLGLFKRYTTSNGNLQSRLVETLRKRIDEAANV